MILLAHLFALTMLATAPAPLGSLSTGGYT
jgi:hypothetical protein